MSSKRHFCNIWFDVNTIGAERINSSGKIKAEKELLKKLDIMDKAKKIELSTNKKFILINSVIK